MDVAAPINELAENEARHAYSSGPYVGHEDSAGCRKNEVGA
jgi:hypothetical protein